MVRIVESENSSRIVLETEEISHHLTRTAAALTQLVGLVVDRRRCLIHEQNLVALQDSSCHANELLFAAREVFSALAGVDQRCSTHLGRSSPDRIRKITEHILVPSLVIVLASDPSSSRHIIVLQQVDPAEGGVDVGVVVLVKDVERRSQGAGENGRVLRDDGEAAAKVGETDLADVFGRLVRTM